MDLTFVMGISKGTGPHSGVLLSMPSFGPWGVGVVVCRKDGDLTVLGLVWLGGVLFRMFTAVSGVMFSSCVRVSGGLFRYYISRVL